MADEPDIPLLWIGKVEGEWPLYAFLSEGQVIHWLLDPERNSRIRRAWRVVGLELGPELEAEVPDPYLREVHH